MKNNRFTTAQLTLLGLMAAILLLITDPLTLYQTGFLFSFTAMLAIVQYSRLFPEQEDEKRTDHEGNRKSIYA